MNDHLSYLSFLSGLKVTEKTDSKGRYYEFFKNGRCVKSAYTYPKAKIFAEGVSVGIKLMERNS